jgi:cold shock protein
LEGAPEIFLRESAGSVTISPADVSQESASLGLSSRSRSPASRCRIPTDDLLGVRSALRCAARQFLFKGIDMTTTQTGTVKWFNESKGYGFIAPDDGGKDLFAHFREIQGADGFKTLAENARVQFNVTQGAKGPQASNICALA